MNKPVLHNLLSHGPQLLKVQCVKFKKAPAIEGSTFCIQAAGQTGYLKSSVAQDGS